MVDFEFSPRELVFPGNLTQDIERRITLRSRSEKCTTFKIKTTCPERYAVKPRLGFLEPQASTEIQIRYRVRGRGQVGWQPESAKNINDRFQLEVRSMSRAEEETYAAAKKQDAEQVRRLLGPQGSKYTLFSDLSELAGLLWKRPQPEHQPRKEVVKCHFTDDTAEQPPAAPGTGAMSTARGPGEEGGELMRLRLDHAKLQEQKRECHLTVQRTLAHQLELRGKSDTFSVPGWLFVLLFLLSIYVGVRLEEGLAVSIGEEPGGEL